MEGNTYATLLHHPFLFKGKPTQAQEVAATSPGGLRGPRVGRDQPLSGLVRLPPKPKAQLGGEGGNPRPRSA